MPREGFWEGMPGAVSMWARASSSQFWGEHWWQFLREEEKKPAVQVQPGSRSENIWDTYSQPVKEGQEVLQLLEQSLPVGSQGGSCVPAAHRGHGGAEIHLQLTEETCGREEDVLEGCVTLCTQRRPIVERWTLLKDVWHLWTAPTGAGLTGPCGALERGAHIGMGVLERSVTLWPTHAGMKNCSPWQGLTFEKFMDASCAREFMLQQEKEPFPEKEVAAETMWDDHNSHSLSSAHSKGENINKVESRKKGEMRGRCFNT